MLNQFITIISVVFLLTACNQPVVHVNIAAENGKHQFYVNGEPFQLKGVGLDFTQGKNFKALKEAGGNAFRTWRTDNAAQQLDSAAKYGLMVALGLDIEKELHDFDYNDEAAVAEQITRLKKEVDTYKDHPNLLCWVAGNELNLLFDEQGGLKLVNPKTYTALAKIVDYIHKVDPHHPVTTTFAGAAKEHVALALKHCPNLDFLSFQVYGGLGELPTSVKQSGFTLPYVVTEFGPVGHWETPATAWGREIEQPSGPRATGMAKRIQQGIEEEETGLCMGGFAFLWGQKQERTPTWYGLFNKSGEATASVDELTKYWTGSYPTNRAPQVDSIHLNTLKATDNIYLKPASECTATVFASDPNNDSLTYQWVIQKEVTQKSQGGAFEKAPETIDFKISKNENGQLEFVAPEGEGDYRLFAYVYDGKNKVGNANVPFFVNKK